MPEKDWISSAFNGLKINIHAPGTGAALMLLALTQVPVAIKTSAEIACIGEVSNQIWREINSRLRLLQNQTGCPNSEIVKIIDSAKSYWENKR